MSEKKEKKYLPFIAVNEFMRDDYRLLILHEVISKMDKCLPAQRQKINKLISWGVQIPGFRNSNMAPVAIKVKNSVSLFEKSSEFASLVMECWSRFHVELKMRMQQLLVERSWDLPGNEEDRSELPGFQVDWPKADNFESLIADIRKALTDLSESDDDISLMAVWVGNRLPYKLFESESE